MTAANTSFTASAPNDRVAMLPAGEAQQDVMQARHKIRQPHCLSAYHLHKSRYRKRFPPSSICETS